MAAFRRCGLFQRGRPAGRHRSIEGRAAARRRHAILAAVHRESFEIFTLCQRSCRHRQRPAVLDRAGLHRSRDHRQMGRGAEDFLYYVYRSVFQTRSLRSDSKRDRRRERDSAEGRADSQIRAPLQGTGRRRRGADADAQGAPRLRRAALRAHHRRALRRREAHRHRHHHQVPGRQDRAHPGRSRGEVALVEFLLQLALNGIVVGSIYALVALGFVIIYKSSGVLNFAQGEFLLLGAYVFWALVEGHAPWPYAVALTILFSILLGLAMERLILRPMIGEPIISVIMVTLGLSSVLRAIVLGAWGTDTRPYPALFSSEPLMLGPLPVSRGYLVSMLVAASLLLVFTLFFRYSRVGIAMRATAFSQEVAQSMGISVRRIFAVSWSIAAVVSALGGILLGSLRGGVDGSLSVLGLKALPVVILGGLDSVAGAIVGGLVIGVLENLSGGYLDPIFGGGVKEVAPFAALVLILMVKPYGLFGKVKIERV